ncbi:MAG: PKD domain-containing protein, partial [Phaeodactylibacter sp.]|nr:PKD domain-containing protein [Phaeodactylibacter sp.]
GSAYFFETCQIPTVSFAASTVTEGAPTTFTDASTNVEAGATYSWDFDNDGNEDATTVGSVSHTYPVAGAYTAKLTITNGLGCTSFRQINVIVKAPDEQVLRHILKQVASDRDVEDRFGFSVDTYGDYVVVGAFQEDGGLSDAGAAYVFKKDHSGSGAWGEVKKLTASDAQSDDYFGYSVSIDGEFIVVGAYSEDTEGSEAGAAYVFHKNEGGADNWGEVKKLTASDGQAGDWFGYSVDISGDNAIVSAYYDDDGGSDAGAAYIFNKDKGGSNNWGQVKKLVAADAQANDRGGLSVAISGEYAVLSAHTETQGGSNAGAAYIFKQDQGGVNNWGEIKKLLASDAQPGDLFGSDLSISGDNIIVGARFEDENGSNAGAAYIFSKEEGGADNWGETAKLIASDGEADDRFGYAVAISGKYALVGAPNEDGFGTDVGAAYLFEQNAAGDWVEVQKNTASDAYFGDEYGRGLALWGDRAVIGAQMEDQDANGNNIRSQAGSVYLYEGCQPPDIAFTADPVILGNETMFTDQSTGVSGVATYAWDFNNDGSIESTTVGDVGYTYLNTGTYTAKLTIDDDGCIISTTVQTEIFEASTEVVAQAGSEQGFYCGVCTSFTQNSYTVAAGANRLMAVGVYRNTGAITSISFNGQNLTPAISVAQNGVSQFWYLPLGTGDAITGDLAITMTVAGCIQGGVTVFDYVNQDTPVGNTTARTFNSIPGFTQSLSVDADNILIDFLRIGNALNPAPGGNQTQYVETGLSSPCDNRVEGSHKPISSALESMNWSWGSSTNASYLLMEVKTCAPKASFTATTVQVGNATFFTDASTRVEMGATYSWDFDDNGTEDDNTVGGTSYTYPNPGTY